MQAIKCELCGSGDLVKKDNMFVCQHCGTKYTVEEARKLLGTVKIDRTDIKENNRILARRAIKNNDFAGAKRYYDILLSEEPNNWEAYFFCALCRALENDNPDKEEACVALLKKTIPTTIELIANYEEDPQEQEDALFFVLDNLHNYIDSSSKFVTKYFKENRRDDELKSGWIHNKTKAYGSLYDTYLISVKRFFPNHYKIASEVDHDYKEFLDKNKHAISWKHRREITKRINQ